MTESHNFVWDADLKKIDGEILTLVGVQTFSFFIDGLFDHAFLDWVDRWADFLVKGEGFVIDSKEEQFPFFYDSSHSEPELSSTNW